MCGRKKRKNSLKIEDREGTTMGRERERAVGFQRQGSWVKSQRQEQGQGSQWDWNRVSRVTAIDKVGEVVEVRAPGPGWPPQEA